MGVRGHLTKSNRLEERSRGELTTDDLDLRMTTYDDHDEWHRVHLPRLNKIGAKRLAKSLGMSERRVRDVLAARSLPHERHRAAYREFVDSVSRVTPVKTSARS